MNSRQRNLLYVRPAPQVAGRIHTRLPIDRREYASLVDLVFGAQRAIYRNQSELSKDSDVLPKHFYESCYEPPTLRYGDLNGPEMSVDHFAQEVLRSDRTDATNISHFLLGDIGVGKTALLNYLISTKLRGRVESGDFWFLKLDLERVRGNPVENSSFDVRRVLRSLCGRVHRIAKDYDDVLDVGTKESFLEALNEVHELDKLSPRASQRSYGIAFARLVDVFRRLTGRRLLLILDNIDYVCHLKDRVLFEHPDDTQESDILIEMDDFIRQFVEGEHLGRMHANVLFTTRFASYRLLRQATATSLGEMPGLDRSYILSEPDSSVVLQSRFSLLKFVADKVTPEGKREAFERLNDLIEGHLVAAPESDLPLFEHLRGIARHGYRELMTFFSQYSWFEGEEAGVGLERFIHQYPVGLLTFMLRKHVRFHQSHARFPNIFKVYRPSGENGRTASFAHSYWLKRLLLEFVKSRPGATSADELLYVFSGESGFEEALVRSCLNDLVDANVSNMLSASREMGSSGRLQVSEVQLTARGRHCCDHIFHRFYYLQLIVEDWHLPLPAVVRHLMTDPPVDYGYVVLPDPEYGEQATRMIRTKASQVLLFLEILAQAYEIERDYFSGAFSRMSQDGDGLIDPRELTNGVVRELAALARHRSLLDVAAVARRARSMRATIRGALEEAYGAGAE